jgi:hypothetical protein
MVATSNGGGGFTYSSNLTPSQISTMATELTTIANFMTSSTSNDVTFYTNSVSVINDYNTVNQFTQMGDAESYLVNNFVGSSKLLSRLNS